MARPDRGGPGSSRASAVHGVSRQHPGRLTEESAAPGRPLPRGVVTAHVAGQGSVRQGPVPGIGRPSWTARWPHWFTCGTMCRTRCWSRLFGVGRSTRPGRRGGTYAACRSGLCGPRPPRTAASDPGRGVRPCAGRGHRAAAGRRRGPGPPACGRPRRTTRVLLREGAMEHGEGHRRVADHRDHTLWTDALLPGRTHDATTARTARTGFRFQDSPNVEVLLDDGCPGLGRGHPGRAIPRPESRTRSSRPRSTKPVGESTTPTHPDASPSNTPSPTANTGSSSFAGPDNG